MDKQDIGNKGAGALGGAIGAALGLAGGPFTSIGAAVVGSLAADVFKDMASRMFSAKEKMRYDNATAYVIDGIKENVQAGLIVRQDGFFEGEDNFSSDAAQLLEGVLMKCKAQYQEKKVKLIANLFKNVAYNELIKPQTAYHVLTIADDLPYHVLCLISYYGRKQDFEGFSLLNKSLHQYSTGTFGEDAWALAQNLFDLYTSGLIEDPNGNGYGARSVIVPTIPILSDRGKTIFNLLELQHVPSKDVEMALAPLRIQTEWEGNRTY